MEKELPKNWVKCSLGEIISSKRGRKPISTIDYWKDGYVPYILIDEMEGKKIRSYTNDPKVSIVSENDVLIVWDGSIGKCGSGLNGAIGSTLVALSPLNNIPTKFIEYILRSKNSFIKQTSTGTGLQHINKDFFEICIIDLPPLKEQNRIVEKLDRLFAQLEVIKNSMEKIPVLLKNFRQQVLTQAMTGNDFPESLGNEIFEFITSGSRGWAQYYSNEGNELFIRITNLSYGTYKIDLSEEKLQFLKLPSSKEGKRTLLRKNDLLISITADTGMIGLVEDDLPYNSYVNQHICLARPKKDIFSKYLVYYLMSSKGFGQFKEMNRGATKVGLTLGDIRNLRIPLPPLREQQEIVSRVETLFAKADSIEEKYKNLKAKIETLPQTILHKAFKGELSEQLETDGDARDLLEEIVALKNGGKAKKVVAKKYVQPDEVLRIVAETDTKEYSTPVEKTAAWYDERFELWVSQQGLAARGSLDKDTLRELFDAMDDEDK